MMDDSEHLTSAWREFKGHLTASDLRYLRLQQWKRGVMNTLLWGYFLIQLGMLVLTACSIFAALFMTEHTWPSIPRLMVMWLIMKFVIYPIMLRTQIYANNVKLSD